MSLYTCDISSPLGTLKAGATDDGVCLLCFSDMPLYDVLKKRVHDATGESFGPGKSRILEQLEAQLAAYFSGASATLDVPLHLIGTSFQQQVWKAVRAISSGSTISYGALSKQLGSTQAVRAVAKANGDNPVLLLVPCHRVVGADGSLTGYSGGLLRKQWLLEHEQRLAGTAVPRLFPA
jgi:AraC family transcriptional regulator of adaptative response/methylated-DNA-[protein]-cysteine methyltransferase